MLAPSSNASHRLVSPDGQAQPMAEPDQRALVERLKDRIREATRRTGEPGLRRGSFAAKPSHQPAGSAKAYYAECPAHGKYQASWVEGAYERWYPPGCPSCRVEALQSNAARMVQIPERYQGVTLDNFDVYDDAQRPVLKATRAYLADFGTHRQSGEGLVLIGPKGTGKNHLTYALAKELNLRGHVVQSTTFGRLYDELLQQPLDRRNIWWTDQVLVSDLLVLDEIGRHTMTTASVNAFFDLVNTRYNHLRPLILISNFDLPTLQDKFGQEAWSRILANNQVLMCDWMDYRMMASALSGRSLGTGRQ